MIWEAVSPSLPGFSVEVLPELDSTNSELMRRGRAGQTDPLLLVAERQTAGRGRLGRAWVGAAGGPPALTFSLGMNLHRQDWSGLSLVVGIAVANALRQAAGGASAAGLGLKWPNDLWWQGGKLGGILIETFGQSLPRYAVIGVGINIVAPPVPADAVFTVPPAGLQQLWPGVDAAKALQCVVPALVQAVQRFEREGFAPFQALYSDIDVLRDAEVHLSDGSRGVARGVDAIGALQVQTAGGMQAVNSGEVSVRPVGYALPGPASQG